jgi:hypothetical protein
METWIRLVTARAVPTDVGTNVARLDRLTLRRLGLTDGEVVEIRARVSAWIRIVAGSTRDDGRAIARVDADILADIGAKPGDWVFLRPAVANVARHVTLRRIVEKPSDEPPGAWNFLEGRTLVVGDVVRVGTRTGDRSGEAHLSVAGLHLVSVDVRQGHVEPASARVDGTDPLGPVTVAPSTTIDLLPGVSGM